MINRKKILESDVRFACGDLTFVRGNNYFEEGKTLQINILKEGSSYVSFNATTLGSARKPYKQSIRVDWMHDFSTVSIDGDCTCPIGFNCKHVASACLEYMSVVTQVSQPATNTPSCLEWLDNLEESVLPASNEEFIAYILKPSKTAHLFSLDFLITKYNKKGGLNKGRKATLNSLRYNYSYTNYIQALDEDIARILYGLETSYQGHPLFENSTGYIALSKLIQSNRLFWKTTQSRPLQPADERTLSFSWQQKNQSYQLSWNIEPDALLILTEPPLYLDESQNSLGTLTSLNSSHQQLKKILSIPEVPAQVVEEFSQRLTLEFPTIALPTPIKVELVEISDIEPIPKITLFGAQLSPTQYRHFIKLNFVYNNVTSSVYSPELFTVVKNKQGIFRIQRQIETEFKAVKQLMQHGFVPTEPNNIKELILFNPGIEAVMDSASCWGKFIQDTLPDLIEQGWLVDTQDNFKLNFQQAEDWHVDIDETDNDWFEMNFKINVNGESISLLPLIMPILKEFNLDDLPDNLNIAIEPHHYINIPSSRLKPFIKIIYELFSDSSINESGSLTLSRYDAATLADLETHSYGVFSLNGGKALIETGKKLKNFKGIADIAIPTGLNATLRGYQQQGLNWLQFLREYNFAGILADDMGLGKTVQTLAHLLVEKQSGRMKQPCLIIAPTSLMGNWRREAERFAPSLKLLTLQGTERKQHFDKIKDYDCILTTYPLLPRDKKTLIAHNYHYLILDESQIIKNPRSQAAGIVKEIKTSHRLCLTGTPMENHLGELWAQFDFLMPGFLGDSKSFKKLYRTPIEIHGDSQQRERLSKRIQPFMLRRNKREVATELPPKTEIIRSVPLYEKQATLYESIRITMEKKVRDAIADKGLARSQITILDALLKLRQTCCDPRTLSLKEAKKVKQSAKLDLLMEMLPALLEEDRRILVFSQFTRMIALIEAELNALKIEYSKLTGQTRKRDEAIERFKSGEADVFLISLKAGGVGLNLTEADTVIIYDPWWNPAVETQAADRAHRIGQDKAVFVYKLMTENTVEEKILAMQEKKRALADSIYQGGKQRQSAKLSSEDLTELFKPITS
ncbi:MAG: DEAD/DEAH box helicase family protein [Methylococcales symbiont of Iophon sp. n. MRB-2018]|nr:MAG: DEAD/DEAH box helicase family protein [Methylococcales symbiont of Iophon sp. n. MRB-2018]KAF3979679.1 MAG: DEAD/DEAH box helicase family protein [Methylococcales symbiont of Iophon sp. n. MRB-2018]